MNEHINEETIKGRLIDSEDESLYDKWDSLSETLKDDSKEKEYIDD